MTSLPELKRLATAVDNKPDYPSEQYQKDCIAFESQMSPQTILTLIGALEKAVKVIEEAIMLNESDARTASVIGEPKDQSHYACRRQNLSRNLAEIKKLVEL